MLVLDVTTILIEIKAKNYLTNAKVCLTLTSNGVRKCPTLNKKYVNVWDDKMLMF